MVEGHVPNQHKKLIAHVRKMVVKQQKKKENKGDSKVSQYSWQCDIANHNGNRCPRRHTDQGKKCFCTFCDRVGFRILSIFLILVSLVTI